MTTKPKGLNRRDVTVLVFDLSSPRVCHVYLGVTLSQSISSTINVYTKLIDLPLSGLNMRLMELLRGKARNLQLQEPGFKSWSQRAFVGSVSSSQQF